MQPVILLSEALNHRGARSQCRGLTSFASPRKKKTRRMALLGEDGLGYELARKIESCGVWRSWLGDSNYASFVHYLASPSAWEAFMRTDDSKTRVQIQLQLRVRALLFDKASVSLFLRSSSSSSVSSSSSSSSSSSASASSSTSSSSSSSSSSSVVGGGGYGSPSRLSTSYLQLHGDDVYFSLEDFSFVLQDGFQQRDLKTKIQPKLAFGAVSKYGEPEVDKNSDEHENEEFTETWYNQFIERYKGSKQHNLQCGSLELHKRTPEGMSTYIKLVERHKRKRQPFKGDQQLGFGNPVRENGSNIHHNSVSEGNNSDDDEGYFFPETMFPSNCVPDSALPPITRVEESPKIEYYGVLDSLPHVMTRSPAMLERFGIRPEYLRIGLGRSKYRGKNGLEGNGRLLGQEQASQMSQKVIARVLAGVGFEGALEVPMDVLSQFLSCHICKLGRILKVLTDNYRKQCSALEVLKMFLHTVGYSNLGALVDHVKDGNRNLSHPSQQQHARGLQPGFQAQPQNPILTNQQIPMQIHPQMQIGHPHNLALQQQQQQQWERIRRRQASTPRSNMNLDKERPLVEVKVENTSDSSMDGNVYAPVNNRQPQMQIRQQQMAAAMANLNAQSAHQFKQLASLHPHLQTQNMVTVRAPPVKVEGFQELMGGDTALKHDSDDHKLTSPSK